MATTAHCALCFETLVAHFEQRQPLTLAQVEELWGTYHANTEQDHNEGNGGSEKDNENDVDMTDVDAAVSSAAKPAAISRLLNRVGASSGSSSKSSLRSTRSSTTASSKSENRDRSDSSTLASSDSSMSSRSSLSSSATKQAQQTSEFPLFVTWNTHSRSGRKSLRGCIGTFEAQKLEQGLCSYALTSALEDLRFQPIPPSLIPSLSAHVTLLTNFSSPKKDPMDWTLGKHGLRISFTSYGRRYGSTYLPDVAKEQEWTKEETLVSLMQKAGWNGSSSSWEKTWRDGRGELITYEGKQVGLAYPEWRAWRDWVDKQGT